MKGDKLIRALARGGRAVWRDGAWVVLRGQDRRGRTIGQLSAASVASLVRSGDLIERDKGLMVWNGADLPRTRQIPAPPVSVSREAPRTPLQCALDAIEDAGVRARARAAAHRFTGDMERAAAGQKVTQNWDTSLHVDGVSGQGCEGGRMLSATQASRRLSQVAAALNEEQFEHLTRLLVEQRSLAGMARAGGLDVREMQDVLISALKALAQAYRLAVSAPR